MNKGFVATTAVILLATGTLAFSLVALGSAVLYADSVNRRELRIQAGLNAEACLDTVALMSVKDYFLVGPVYISEFGCDAVVSRDGSGYISIKASASLNGVHSDVLDKKY
jgi:hypothetical protein